MRAWTLPQINPPAVPEDSGRRRLGEWSMTRIASNVAQSYLQCLLAGDRNATRKVIDSALSAGSSAYDLLNGLVWPTMELLQSLYRDDRIGISSLNLATRLNRSITDQLCSALEKQPSNGKKTLIF